MDVNRQWINRNHSPSSGSECLHWIQICIFCRAHMSCVWWLNEIIYCTFCVTLNARKTPFASSSSSSHPVCPQCANLFSNPLVWSEFMQPQVEWWSEWVEKRKQMLLQPTRAIFFVSILKFTFFLWGKIFMKKSSGHS